MFGAILIFVAWVAFMLPIIASFVSDRICCWFLKHVQFFRSFLMAAYTVGFLGVAIVICDFLIYLIKLIF